MYIFIIRVKEIFIGYINVLNFYLSILSYIVMDNIYFILILICLICEYNEFIN